MRRMILAVCGRLYAWALVGDLLALLPMDRRELQRLVAREMAAIRASIIEHYRYQDREARILNDRLSRRYDFGMAMNEAASRAIHAKQAAAKDNLTAKQKLALEVQENHLRRVIRDS